MPAKRLSMRKLKDVLRLRFEHELSDRAIGRSCSISHRTVADCVQRFYLCGLSWPLPGDLDEKALAEKLSPEKPSTVFINKIIRLHSLAGIKGRA